MNVQCYPSDSGASSRLKWCEGAWRNVVTVCLHNDPSSSSSSSPSFSFTPPPPSLLPFLESACGFHRRHRCCLTLLPSSPLLLRRRRHRFVMDRHFFFKTSCSPLALSSWRPGSRADARARTLSTVSGKENVTHCKIWLLMFSTWRTAADAH